MKKYYTSILTVVVTALLVLSLFVGFWRINKINKLRTQIQSQFDVIDRQHKLIKTQEETIDKLESWIELEDPDYIIMWERPCSIGKGVEK